MSGRLRAVQGHQVDWLSAGWQLAASTAGAIDGPAALGRTALDWVPTVVPSTAASSLRSAGSWSLDGDVRRFDAHEWWYRARFDGEPARPGEQLWLCFDGLATVADVWLNGDALLSSEGMFVAHECRVDGAWRADNELVIRFRSLDALLAARRPRPRWRAPMVENQQLRWFRTTLLGRTPGWSPPAAAVGPWRGIRLERRRGVMIENVRLRAHEDGGLDVDCSISSTDGAAFSGADIVLERGGRTITGSLAARGTDGAVGGRLLVPHVERWWPHTHGDPALYSAWLRVRHGGGVVDADLGAVGFRSVALANGDGDFSVQINGTPVFCRGACWTPLDPVAFAVESGVEDRALAQVVDAGMNMLRVGGTMVYESDHFLDQCDARGILLWQDFMFANLDYPGEDSAFLDAVDGEARQHLARLQGRPSLTVLCGNSEGEQQAAMWGAPRERWEPALFHERLAALAREACPDVPYWPSSAHGGAFPHQGSSGAASYYGVGAYMRPLEDARRSEVRFASECLAFANVPDERTLALLPGGYGVEVHHPAWKARSPRDLGAGWDFDDVRDHYMALLFRVDPLALRYADRERYLALARVVTGEVMDAVFSEWRRKRSVTRGGLVWFLRDLWAGAGWGVVDATGAPKAAWHYLKRALAPIALSFSDEGCNGLAVHVVNDRAAIMRGELEVTLYRAGGVQVGKGTQKVEVAAHSASEINAETLFDGFLDLSYAYRFGPPMFNVAAARLRDDGGAVLARAFHFVSGLPNTRELDIGLAAAATLGHDGAYDLVVRTCQFAQSVCIDMAGFESNENYFHLAPGDERRLHVTRTERHDTQSPAATPRGTVRALNAETPAQIVIA
jgi:beta-mannosidase